MSGVKEPRKVARHDGPGQRKARKSEWGVEGRSRALGILGKGDRR